VKELTGETGVVRVAAVYAVDEGSGDEGIVVAPGSSRSCAGTSEPTTDPLVDVTVIGLRLAQRRLRRGIGALELLVYTFAQSKRSEAEDSRCRSQSGSTVPVASGVETLV
jgi:hypothetical protein